MKFYSMFYVLFCSLMVGATEKECRPTNYAELVQCLETFSTEIRISEQSIKAESHLAEMASQWINPELDAESVGQGSEKAESSATLFFTIRLGGRKSARVEEANQLIFKADLSHQLIVQRARLQFMISLYRLSHLKNEIQIEQESIRTFSKIVYQYQRRASLSPEQDVSSTVFKMALSDHQFRLVKLQTGEDRLFQDLSDATGLARSVFANNLPPAKTTWPQLNEEAVVKDSIEVRLAAADLELAKVRSEIVKTSVWPDLKVGPSLKEVRENGSRSTLYGVALSMALPVFNAGGADRSYGSEKVIESTLQYDLAKIKILSNRNILVRKYERTRDQLKNSISLKYVMEKHERLERQFLKGLVPSSLVIEAHRQLFDFAEQRNNAEVEAIHALGQVLIYDEKLAGVVL